MRPDDDKSFHSDPPLLYMLDNAGSYEMGRASAEALVDRLAQLLRTTRWALWERTRNFIESDPEDEDILDLLATNAEIAGFHYFVDNEDGRNEFFKEAIMRGEEDRALRVVRGG